HATSPISLHEALPISEKPSASRGVVDALRGLYATFLLQEFIAEAGGADIRCLVVGDEVVAAMRRQAPPGDFRANLHRGGSAEGLDRKSTRLNSSHVKS